MPGSSGQEVEEPAVEAPARQFVGQNLGVLPGDKYSDAWDVNDEGHALANYNSAAGRHPQLIKASIGTDHAQLYRRLQLLRPDALAE